MLEAWIIDELLQRERRLRDERAQVELPIYPPEPPAEETLEREADEGEDDPRGIAVVDYRV